MSDSSNLNILLKEIFETKPELSALLAAPYESGAFIGNGSFSFTDLVSRNIIGFDMEHNSGVSENIPCRLIATLEDDTVILAFLCLHSQWMLGPYKQRPLEIAQRIWDAADGHAILNGQVLYLKNCSIQALSDKLSLFSIILNTFEPMDHETRQNPFADYERIFQRIADELLSREPIANLLGVPCASGSEECIRKGLLRFYDAIVKPEDSMGLITLTMDDDVDDLSMNVTALRWKSGNDEEDIAQLNSVMESIIQAITSIPGFSEPRWDEPEELGGILHFVNGIFPFTYDSDAFEENAKPCQSRPNFFISAETMTSLLDTEEDPEAPAFDFSVDLIDFPYRLFYVHEEEQDTVKVKKRLEISSYKDPDDPTAVFTVRHGSDEATVTMNEENEPLQNVLTGFYLLGRRIRTYVRNQGLYDEIRYAAADSKGLLIENENGDFTHRMLEGQSRPDILCYTLFDGLQMMRPYSEDVNSDMQQDSMGLDEKIEAAEQGDKAAMEALGMLYLNGDGETAPDPGKAFHWFHKLAEAGSSSGMFNTGLFYAKGFGVERDLRAAAEWMQKAADHGDEDGKKEAEKYCVMAENLVKAQEGNHAAQADLAISYMELGNALDQAGREEDFAESLKWASAAAEAGYAKAFWVLGLAFEHGRGVRQDSRKAADLYETGAEKGDAACQNSIGCMFLKGDPAELDQEKGYMWIRKSAEQGYGPGMKNLGQCYQFGNGCPESMSKAIEWYEKYLTIADDPEMQQKVEIFKHLQTVLDEDESEEKDADSWQPPEGYMDAMQAFSEADEYEQELYEDGFLPELPAPSDDGIMGEDQYPRLMQKASDGDERAIRIAKALGWTE